MTTALFLETRLPSPIGEVLLLTDEAGAVRALNFGDYRHRMTRSLDQRYRAGGWVVQDAKRLPDAARAIDRYFEGDVDAIDSLDVNTGGTAFQQLVWLELRKIRAGETYSYTELAQAVGRPAAVRAVGSANGSNPVSLIVPCHRLIGSSGSLTGYGGGLHRKEWLLAHEARHARKDQGEKG